MPDIAAGHKLTTLDFLPAVPDTEDGSYEVTATTFGVAVSTGTYVDCGAPFIGPYSGRVEITVSARCGNSGAAAATEVAPVVRTGGTVGSGSTVVAAASASAVRHATGAAIAAGIRASISLLVEGLTPGDTYNVRLEHRVSGTTGTIANRHVVVVPTN